MSFPRHELTGKPIGLRPRGRPSTAAETSARRDLHLQEPNSEQRESQEQLPYSCFREINSEQSATSVFGCINQNSKKKFRHLHGDLNLDEIKKHIVTTVCKWRDESNEPN